MKNVDYICVPPLIKILPKARPNMPNRNKGNFQNKTKYSRLVDKVDSRYMSAGASLTGDDRIVVYVEGFEDIGFWRPVFDRFTTRKRRFKIMTPDREDLAKGKKVVLAFESKAGKNLLLCVDSDFDYIVGDASPQAKRVNESPWIIQTYVYAIENLQCAPLTLQSLSVTATHNDVEIFDFNDFFSRYSKIIYPIFQWYLWASIVKKPEVISLSEFRNTVKINFLDPSDISGIATLGYVKRMVTKKNEQLKEKYKHYLTGVKQTQKLLESKNIRPNQVIYYMQGHTFRENVVVPVFDAICKVMRLHMQGVISRSKAKQTSERNQISAFLNSQQDIDQLLDTNLGYMSTPYYQKIEKRIQTILDY